MTVTTASPTRILRAAHVAEEEKADYNDPSRGVAAKDKDIC